MKLDPINIAVIAPTGAGKTSLITTIISHIRKSVDANFEIKTSNREADKLKELKVDLRSANINFNSAMIKGTSVCSQYQFSIIYKDRANNIEIEQPFDIMDIPGGYINNPDKYNEKDEYKKFLLHLSKSRIIWIPIDTPLLMSPVTIDEKECSRMLRSVDNIKNLIEYWAIPAEKNALVNSYYLNFILLKCETYFSQDKKNEYYKCRRQFDDNYDGIVSFVKENSKKTNLACASVETIGSIKVKTVDWDIEKKSVDVKYRTTGTEQYICGADCILNDALIIAREMIEDKIRMIKLTRSTDRDKYAIELEELLSDLQRRKQENTEIISKLSKYHYDLQCNKDYLREEEDKSWLGRLFKGDYRGYYRNKIEAVQALIDEQDSISKDLTMRIYELKNAQSDKEQEIEDVEAEISGLEILLEQISKLGICNKNTDYYRTL